MLTMLSDSRPRQHTAWVCSLVLHVFAAAAIATFGARVLSTPKSRSVTLLIAPAALPEAKPSSLPKPKLKQFTLAKLPLREMPKSIGMPTPMAAPAIRPAITVPEAPQIQVLAAPPAAPAPAFETRVQPAPASAPRVALQTAGFHTSVPDRPDQKARLTVQEGTDFASSTSKREVSSGRAGAVPETAFGGTFGPRGPNVPRSGAVSSSGFGETVTLAAARKPTHSVGGASFGDAALAKPTAVVPREPENAAADTTPVAIIFHPRPVSPEGARNLQIEGHVLVQVVFTASGEVKVLRLVRGLGHGLDESARAAVEAIRFRPAHRQGRPVDSTATVRLNFELAF